MNPFFFGASERPLFGLYQPPRAPRGRATGVVLCYPVGQEYMRAHRAFRQLAMLLNKSGFHVLRFDYFGTGDSGGTSEEGSLEQWITDVGTAIDELKDMAGVSRVALVGSRLGGTVAALAAAHRRDVASLVLWDPVIDGVRHLSELVGEPALAAVGAGETTIGVLGFPLTAPMREELGRLDLTTFQPPREARVHIVVADDRPDCMELRDRLAPGCARADYECLATPCNWNEVDNYGSSLIPQAIIRAIVTRLGEECS